jgi:hypothetical protein
MPHTQKSGVKKLLSPQFHTKRLLWPSENEPNAAGSSAAEKDPIEAKAMSFAEDFILEHSSPGAPVAPAHQVSSSFRPQPPAVSKSAPA